METAESEGYITVPRGPLEQLLASLNVGTAPLNYDPAAILEEFELACRIDYHMRPATIVERIRHVKRLLGYLDKHPLDATRQELRRFLEFDPAQNAIKALRVLYWRFFESDLAACFKVPQSPPHLIVAPNDEQLKFTYKNLNDPELEAAFLTLGSSGLRRHEFVELTWRQIDMEERVIYPDRQGNTTKLQWVTCFNEEAKAALSRLFLAKSPNPNERICTCFKDTLTRKLKRASAPTGFKITPQILRDWFSCEMGRLGVPDRYVDAFCGRIPRRVLGRHYTDYSVGRMKEIYDKANLKVLECSDNGIRGTE